MLTLWTVSYTHLDVYKIQDMNLKTDGYDVLQFAWMNSTGTGDEEIVVLRAENKENAERVAMMDEFVQVKRCLLYTSIPDAQQCVAAQGRIAMRRPVQGKPGVNVRKFRCYAGAGNTMC